ncbi:hypothetical protein N8766_01375 [bacterium]|jgi:hypothetical protein|nr:hypothetical protein [Verrucomicrobiota bacterium]MDA7632736.1 hypothetical protein [bacterium]MDA7667614.1 hypothetical protein [bacterium]
MNAATRDSLSVTPKKFDRFGDSHYLRIDSAEALRQVLALPEARWFASNAPVEAFRADSLFLQYLNENRDGRLRPQEIKAAIRWLLGVFGRLSDEGTGSRSLRFDRIKEDGVEGRRVLAAAKKVLCFLNKEGQRQVDLIEVEKVKKLVETDGLGKPGWVGKSVECSEPCRRLIQDVLETVSDGNDAVCEDDLNEFLRQCRALEEWENELKSGSPLEWLPFGDDTDDRYHLFADLHDRMEGFFSLCQLAKISPRVKSMATVPEANEEAINLGDVEEIELLAQTVPIAAVNSDAALKFNGPLNPINAEQIHSFRDLIFVPLFGETSQTLKRDQWEEVKAKFAHYDVWIRRRPDVFVGDLDPERRAAHLVANSATTQLRLLLEESRENAVQLESVKLLEKAILFQAHLLAFANNFVSCPDLYSPAGRALFEMGTMILDGREFTFCVKVPDRDRHIRRCQGENMFVIYAAISDVEGNIEYEIAAPVTSGFRGHLREGQWGVFHDSLGKEFNAQVTRLLESPISFWEGLLAPFRRLGRAAILRLDSLSLEAETGLQDRLVKDRPTIRKEEASGESAILSRGFLASGGLAVAALGSAGAYIAQTLARTELWDLFWASVGLVSVLLIPLVFTTFMRLKNRDLRCLLEGASWGVNLRMRLTPTLARTFTRQRRI